MNTANWVNALKEALAAVADGARSVPPGDGGEARHFPAVELAELRLGARLGRAGSRSWLKASPALRAGPVSPAESVRGRG